ncbi:MAG: 16S rRNA (guanine(527)-N(7))-methyltransferase RsmG [Stackebrandtia sp.]
MSDDRDERTAGDSSEAPAVSRARPDEADSPARDDVSRETATPHSAVAWRQPPAAAATVFGDRLEAAEQYAELLAGEAVLRGLIGPREAERLWDRHLLNCAVLGELIDSDADVLDVGSGAGLPGIPLAIARPDLWVTLVEPMERRSGFLDEVVALLGLPNVEVVRARAEQVTPRGKADAVTSRAVAPLGKLVGWCLPLARPGGEMLAIKGASAADEASAHADEVSRARGTRPEVTTCGDGLLETPTTVIRVRRR